MAIRSGLGAVRRKQNNNQITDVMADFSYAGVCMNISGP